MVVPIPAPKPPIAPSKVAPAYLSQLSSNALKSDQSNPSCISEITFEIYGWLKKLVLYFNEETNFFITSMILTLPHIFTF